MSVTNLMLAPITRAPDEVYSYPATALVLIFQNELYEMHFIWYTAAPSTNFDNAPNGSYFWDGTNFNFYIKSGTLGLKDGTWKTEALS